MKPTAPTAVLACLLFAIGCNSTSSIQRVANPVVRQQTIEGVGVCQGVMVRDGSVWVYGDRGKGIVRRFDWSHSTDTEAGPALVDSKENYELKLYRNFFARSDPQTRLPSNLVPHPAGLTVQPDFVSFVGNIEDNQSTIVNFFWEGFTESGNLDDWVYNVTVDDLATSGSRPEFVRVGDRWLIATADNGGINSKLRLYDPEKLAKAKKTSDPGVLVAEFDCGPYVQSLHWIDAENTLVLAQNQSAGRGARLTLMKFGENGKPIVERVIDLGAPKDELKGFAVVEPGWAVLISSSSTLNATIIRWPIDETDR